MENNGKGIFYGVIGVATLIVAIIGATFAYFSATVSGNGSDITGTTLNVSGTALSLEVNKVTFSGTTAPSNDLVPADMVSGAAITSTDINRVTHTITFTTSRCRELPKYRICIIKIIVFIFPIFIFSGRMKRRRVKIEHIDIRRE